MIVDRVMQIAQMSDIEAIKSKFNGVDGKLSVIGSAPDHFCGLDIQSVDEYLNPVRTSCNAAFFFFFWSGCNCFLQRNLH